MEETVETQRVGFSSENFKIEINNLPKFFSVGQAKKLLKNKLQLNPHKFKPVGKNAKYMFVNFANEEDRNQAIEKLNGFQLKGNKLRAFAANAAKDPLSKIKDEKEDTRPVTERIADAVCGLHNMDYEKQLESKLTEIETIAKNLRREYVKQLPVLKFDDVAEVKPFLPSPVVNGYRNKCEFTIGRHPETNEITIGFRLASYKKGSIAVVEADHLPIVSDQMKQIIKYFQSFVRESGYDAYNHINMQGHWRQLTVRTNRKGDAMVWAILHPQSMSQEQKDDLAKGIRDHFNSDKTAGILDRPISSLYLQFLGQREKGKFNFILRSKPQPISNLKNNENVSLGAPDPPIQLLTGEPSISETLVDGKLKFEISPQSFFQVNVEGAEKLYSKCAELANLNKENTVLFDVCCGTGTIGLCLADKCLKVIGVDIVEEAIENAKKNAKANNIDNAEYHAGKF